MPLNSYEIVDLTEGFDFEVKKAAGRDRKGQLPDSFFPTYSAMANTEGGVVLLGIEEADEEQFQVVGVANPAKVIKELWSSLNNKQKISANILNERDVQIIEREGKTVIQINIPRATRFQLPVYLGQNPLIGTYRRQGDGDFRCDEEAVKRMLCSAFGIRG